MDALRLADEIIEGRRLGREAASYELLECELEPLLRGADKIRKHFFGDRLELCSIVNGKSGSCSENCRFCAQSAHNNTSCKEYPLLSEEEIFLAAAEMDREGVAYFSLVCSGRSPAPKDFERILSIVRSIRSKLGIGLCCSLGFLTREQLRLLRAAGVSRIHCNIESSRRFFPNICTSHSFDEKLENIRRAQAEGLYVCSGGILGMGESREDRLDMAIELKELGISSIPLNTLIPIPGTPLEGLTRLSENEILRSIAAFKYINPEAHIRLAGGRALMADSGREAFNSGASASITGNMLTSSGNTVKQDKEMLDSMGRILCCPQAELVGAWRL